MVATAQRPDRPAAERGPGKAGSGWQRGAGSNIRTLPQNAFVHGLIRAAVKGGIATDDGRRLTFYEAKVAFVTAWMIEEGHHSDIVAFAGHPIQLRRSTAELDKSEASALADFIQAECAQRGIVLAPHKDEAGR